MHALASCAGKLNSVVLVCKAIQYLTVSLPYIISIIFLGQGPKASSLNHISLLLQHRQPIFVTDVVHDGHDSTSRRIVTDASGRALCRNPSKAVLAVLTVPSNVRVVLLIMRSPPPSLHHNEDGNSCVAKRAMQR